MKKIRTLYYKIGLILLTGCFVACEEIEVLYDHEQQLVEDIALIDAYLEERNIQAEIHPSGMRYIIEEPGDPMSVTEETLISFSTQIRRLDGERFETQVNGTVQAFTFDVSIYVEPDIDDNLFQCLYEAAQLLGEDGRIRMYVPSGLSVRDLESQLRAEANGQNIRVTIPPKTVFVMDAWLYEVEEN